MRREGEEAHAEISEGFETIETPPQLLHAPVAEALTAPETVLGDRPSI